MESKIATYTEAKVRLQLVRVSDGNLAHIELRLNRKCIAVYPSVIFGSARARLSFISAIHQILVLRSCDLSYLTI